MKKMLVILSAIAFCASFTFANEVQPVAPKAPVEVKKEEVKKEEVKKEEVKKEEVKKEEAKK